MLAGDSETERAERELESPSPMERDIEEVVLGCDLERRSRGSTGEYSGSRNEVGRGKKDEEKEDEEYSEI